MHILFVHQNYPAEFGPLAHALVHRKNWRCTFVSGAPAAVHDGVENIQYNLEGGATRHTHFCSRTFENAVWHCDAILRAVKNRPDVEPDLIVGHSGLGSTLFLREIFPRVPVVNLFEMFYRPRDPQSDIDFRKDLGWSRPDQIYQRARCRNAMVLLDLNNCQAGYCATQFQRSRFPIEYQSKLRTIFDGIDPNVFHSDDARLRPPAADRPARQIAGVDLPPGRKIVTYVSRSFESIRGFDIFMRAAKIIAAENPDVEFFIAGSDQILYGSDADHIAPHKSFKDWTLAQQEYDLSRFHFVGTLLPNELAELMGASDLHIYLTVPFVLSWSMLNAMSCGAVVLGSSTPPVMEFIRDGKNGLLADFFCPEEFAAKALEVLKNPDDFRNLGKEAEELMAEVYSFDVVLPQSTTLFEQTANGTARPAAPVSAPITLDHIGDVFTSQRPRTRSPFRG
ncbi:MAG: glycosyltransferase [Tepidisphaeraceae bacterium]|jgi:glycosyltransferase involved in cell wall biosynthesis